jgi:hypothetical protein
VLSTYETNVWDPLLSYDDTSSNIGMAIQRCKGNDITEHETYQVGVQWSTEQRREECIYANYVHYFPHRLKLAIVAIS